MEPIKKEDLSQDVFDIYDEYVHSRIDRREFVHRLSAYAVGGLTVSAILSFLLPNYVEAKRFHQNDPGLITGYEEYDSPKGAGKMRGLLARPADKKDKPQPLYRRRCPASRPGWFYCLCAGCPNSLGRLPRL